MLFSVFLFFCAALVNAQIPASRTVTAASVGVANNMACYVISAEWAVVPNTSVVGNVFAAAMGINIPGTSQLYPWTALAYVKGNIDATTYASGALTQVHVAAQANIVAWSYVAIGEFCDTNSVSGFQPVAGDYIINYYTAPTALLYNLNCAQETDPITGDNSYMASVQTATGQYFNVTCRVFPKDTTTLRNGRTVGPYDFKCDIRIDYSTLWTSDAAKINGCSDANRKIGLLINIAGGSVDIDASATALNTAALNTPDGEHITYGAGRLRFSWDNYYVKTASFPAVTGTNDKITATFVGHQTLDASNSIYGVRVVDQIIFAFDAPKSAATMYYWDPTTTVLDTTTSSALSACLSMVVLCFLSFFLF